MSSLVMLGLVMLSLAVPSAWLLVGSRFPDPRDASPWPWRWAWGWLLAQASVSLGAGLLWLLAAPLRWALFAPVLVLVVAQLRRRPGPPPLRPPTPTDPWLRLAVVLFGLWAIFSAWTTVELGWDGLAIWGLKGRTLAATDAYPLLHPLARSSHPEYPLHLPLLAAVVAQWCGGWQDRLLPLLTAFDVTALGLLLCHGLEARRGAPWLRRCLLVATLVTPMLWRELTTGKADLNLAFCLTACVVGLESWLRDGRRQDLRLAAVAVGLAAWSKQEGMAYGVIFCLLAIVLTGPQRRHGLPSALFPALAIPLPWHALRRLLDISTEPFAVGTTTFERLPTVVASLASTMARLDLWGLLWWLALPACAWWLVERLRRRARSDRWDAQRALDVPPLLLMAGLGFIVTAYLTSPYDVAWHLQTSAERLLLQLLPVTALAAHSALESHGALQSHGALESHSALQRPAPD